MTRLKTSFGLHQKLALAIAFLALGNGCSKSDVELGGVEGTVMMDDKPLPDATIRFIPVGGGRSALGRTDAAGHYTMLYSATASGAMVGAVRVEITTGQDGEIPIPETVPAKYNESSELTAEVGAESNVIDFRLNSK